MLDLSSRNRDKGMGMGRKDTGGERTREEGVTGVRAGGTGRGGRECRVMKEGGKGEEKGDGKGESCLPRSFLKVGASSVCIHPGRIFAQSHLWKEIFQTYELSVWGCGKIFTGRFIATYRVARWCNG